MISRNSRSNDPRRTKLALLNRRPRSAPAARQAKSLAHALHLRLERTLERAVRQPNRRWLQDDALLIANRLGGCARVRNIGRLWAHRSQPADPCLVHRLCRSVVQRSPAVATVLLVLRVSSDAAARRPRAPLLIRVGGQLSNRCARPLYLFTRRRTHPLWYS